MQQRFFLSIPLVLILQSPPEALGFLQCRLSSQTSTALLSRQEKSSSSSVFLSSTSTSTSSSETTITETEIQTLFDLLADSTLLYDPSRGTCCRNKCRGCAFLDSGGNFLFDQFTASNDGNKRGWLAPYVKVDFGERVQSSKWSTLLFPTTSVENGGATKNIMKKEVERKEFTSLLLGPNVNATITSPLVIQALWNILSPSIGYPRLSSTEIIRAIKGMNGSIYDMGGAVPYESFAKNLLTAVDDIQQRGGLHEIYENGDGKSSSNGVVDYDIMSKEELVELCQERGMKTNFPKMKRIIIEELRFFDANGRQGKRHPVKNTLS